MNSKQQTVINIPPNLYAQEYFKKCGIDFGLDSNGKKAICICLLGLREQDIGNPINCLRCCLHDEKENYKNDFCTWIKPVLQTLVPMNVAILKLDSKSQYLLYSVIQKEEDVIFCFGQCRNCRTIYWSSISTPIIFY